MENINGGIIDLCSDVETESLVEPIDSSMLQFNPVTELTGITNSLPIFEQIGGNASEFIVGGGGTHHFHQQSFHHLPSSGLWQPSASGSGRPSANEPFRPFESAPCSHASELFYPSARGSNCPSASRAEPLCRQFWKAGDYTPSLNYGVHLPGRQSCMRIHPKFLHSNATSHKWAFGAIAELLDNAIDEVANGATFVKVDKIINPKDGNYCLVVQDDGGGMGPDSLRRCMGFGFSEKCTGSSIGQYGNGFKTSTMRLGADVIVFSRCLKERGFTQSIGLLSYTYLRKLKLEEIIVPAVDYEFEASRGIFRRLCSDEKFSSNLSTLLHWSPFGTELELQKQFDEIGAHGTRIVIFNLWLNDAGEMELDFKSDHQDIMLSGSPRAMATNNAVRLLNQTYVANQYRYSLRVYTSILYLHLPKNFRIIICDMLVAPYYIVNDLQYRQCIKYRPQVGHVFEAEVTTVIGFLKGAPNINVHGFCIYHKNRLILPFFPVVSDTGGTCKGVAGVLEANFIKPTHDKQDFEKSALFQKLEIRLRDMAKEYWGLHCYLVGYKQKKQTTQKQAICKMPSSHSGTETGVTSLSRSQTENPDQSLHGHGLHEPVVNCPPSTGSNDLSPLFEPVILGKKNKTRIVDAREASRVKKQAIISAESESTGQAALASQRMEELQRTRLRSLVSENAKLSSQCSEYEASEKELSQKAESLALELQNARLVYEGLLGQLASINRGKFLRF